MDIYQTLQKELDGKVIENEPLANYTTFKIGGPAQYFFTAENLTDLIKAIKSVKKLNLPYFILGRGSNLLVSDKGFKGLIIRVINDRLEIRDNRIRSETGVDLGKLVREATNVSLSGLEFLAGIPGTVGAAVYGNAGAFGKSTADVLISAEILTKDNKVRKVENKWFNFRYRDSRLKDSGEIVLRAEFQLKKSNKEEIKKTINEILKIRKEKIPPYASAGSIFKNIELRTLNEKLKTLFQEKAKGGKVATGFLIDQCGLKGTKIGRAEISKQHANFIINRNGAKAKDVLELIKLIKKKVYDKFGIKLKEEVKIL